MLMMTSHNLARNIWINAKEREESAAEDLLGKVCVRAYRVLLANLTTATVPP